MNSLGELDEVEGMSRRRVCHAILVIHKIPFFPTQYPSTTPTRDTDCSPTLVGQDY